MYICTKMYVVTIVSIHHTILYCKIYYTNEMYTIKYNCIFYKCIQMYKNVYKCIQMYINVFKCLQMYTNIYKFIQIYTIKSYKKYFIKFIKNFYRRRSVKHYLFIFLTSR